MGFPERRAFLVSTLALAAAAGLRATAQESRGKPRLVIERYADEAEQFAWTAYGVSLAATLGASGEIRGAPPGRHVPSFAAEVEAREKQAQIWREVNEKQKVEYAYMDQMLKVSAAGFMRQYVWHFHRQPSWDGALAPPRLDEFKAWASEQLQGHRPHTGAQVVIDADR